jgi:hypothetical protein
MWMEKAETPPLARGRGGVWTTSCLKLFPDLVGPFASGVLGRLDLLSSLAAQDADEAAYGVRLPASCLHDLGKRGAFGALHHLDDLGLLVGAVRLWLGGLLGAARFLRWLRLLNGFACAFGLRRIGSRLAHVLAIDYVVAHFRFLLDLVAVVTFFTPGGRNIKSNLREIRSMRRMPLRAKGNWRAWSLYWGDKIRDDPPARAGTVPAPQGIREGHLPSSPESARQSGVDGFRQAQSLSYVTAKTSRVGSARIPRMSPSEAWVTVRQFLLNNLGITESDPLAAWLARLETDKEFEQFATCLSIDLVCGAISVEDALELLNTVDLDDGMPARAFQQAFKNFPQHADLSCRSMLNSPKLADDEWYISVMRIEKFITQYAGPSSGLPSLGTLGINEVETLYFSGPETPLGDITTVNPGASGVVWVTLSNAFNNLRTVPDRLKDSLGLAFPRPPGGTMLRLVAIRYPSAFAVDCKQPTTFDAYWGAPNWYLSHGSVDGWGRTCPCSPEGVEMPERVHKSLARLDATFLALHVGEVTIFAEDREHLVGNARARFRRFVV